jgi:ABC-type oligopeptide transport system ATPase subunit
MSLLEVRDLSIDFGARRVVDRVSFTLDAGEKLALVGESASGKTVTALSTLRLIENARLSGDILFNGKSVLAMPPDELHQLRGRDIAVIFQEPMTGAQSDLLPSASRSWNRSCCTRRCAARRRGTRRSRPCGASASTSPSAARAAIRTSSRAASASAR